MKKCVKKVVFLGIDLFQLDVCKYLFIYMTMYLLRLVAVAQVFEVFQVWYFVIFNGEVIAYLNHLWVSVEKIINNRFYFVSSFSPWIFFEKVSFNVSV